MATAAKPVVARATVTAKFVVARATVTAEATVAATKATVAAAVAAAKAAVAPSGRRYSGSLGNVRDPVGSGNRKICGWGGRGGGLCCGDATEQHPSGQRAGTHCTSGRAADRW